MIEQIGTTPTANVRRRPGMVSLGPDLLDDLWIAKLPDKEFRALILSLARTATDNEFSSTIRELPHPERARIEDALARYGYMWRGLAHFKRGAWSRANVAAVKLRDGSRCRYCNRAARPCTIDHVLPRSRGGSDETSNLVVACKECNQRKSARTPDEAGMRLLPVPGAH